MRREATTGRGPGEDGKVAGRPTGGGLEDSARRVVRTTGIAGMHACDPGCGGRFGQPGIDGGSETAADTVVREFLSSARLLPFICFDLPHCSCSHIRCPAWHVPGDAVAGQGCAAADDVRGDERREPRDAGSVVFGRERVYPEDHRIGVSHQQRGGGGLRREGCCSRHTAGTPSSARRSSQRSPLWRTRHRLRRYKGQTRATRWQRFRREVQRAMMAPLAMRVPRRGGRWAGGCASRVRKSG